jgi:hypothetical protein
MHRADLVKVVGVVVGVGTGVTLAHCGVPLYLAIPAGAAACWVGAKAAVHIYVMCSYNRAVVHRFYDYCGAYLRERCGLSPAEATLLLCDPELGPDMDEVKNLWLGDLRVHGIVDPDALLVPKLFDAPGMRRVNLLLEEYAREYSGREARIKAYLRSIGHPLGGRGDEAGGEASSET